MRWTVWRFFGPFYFLAPSQAPLTVSVSSANGWREGLKFPQNRAPISVRGGQGGPVMWVHIGGVLSVMLAVAAIGFLILFIGRVRSILEENKAEAEVLDVTAEDLEPGGVG